ncbi:MAG TPA: glycosyltransferase [Terriglobales bacterium]
MRFLIAPNFALPYDQRMVRGLAAALTAAGHDARALLGPLHEAEAAGVCQTLGIEVLLQVNRFRPLDPPLPKGVRHVVWFQDIFPETINDLTGRIHEEDIVYTLGDPHVLGVNTDLPCKVGTFLTGIEPSEWITKERSLAGEIDFSLCGFIPPHLTIAPHFRADVAWYLIDLINRVPLAGSPLAALARYMTVRKYVPTAIRLALISVVESLYRPLRGELDIHALKTAMVEAVVPYAGTDGIREAWSRRQRRRKKTRFDLLFGDYQFRSLETNGPIMAFISYLARDYPRALDRIALVQSVLALSDSVELYGNGWQLYDEFKRYHQGVLATPRELARVYRRSRINLANNTHGLGLHARTLECMATGGFILIHESPNDEKPGGMLTSFEPDLHYGAFKPETLQETALRWLKDENGRGRAGANAAKIVRDKHLWRHRAAQLIADLKQ